MFVCVTVRCVCVSERECVNQPIKLIRFYRRSQALVNGEGTLKELTRPVPEEGLAPPSQSTLPL